MTNGRFKEVFRSRMPHDFRDGEYHKRREKAKEKQITWSG